MKPETADKIYDWICRIFLVLLFGSVAYTVLIWFAGVAQ